MRGMNHDRHIYLATGVLAAVFATAINALAPRDPFAGTIQHRETTPAATAQAGERPAVEIAGRVQAQPRARASL